MKYTARTHTLTPHPLILSGASGASGAALSGAGLRAVGVWCNSGAEWCKTGKDSPLKPVRPIPPPSKRALTGNRQATTARYFAPLFWRKGCLRATPTGQFSEQRTGKKIAMILTAITLAASGFGHRPVDNSPRFRGVVDNFSRGPVCVPAYLLSNLCKSPKGLPGVPCGQTGAKVMHNGHYA